MFLQNYLIMLLFVHHIGDEKIMKVRAKAKDVDDFEKLLYFADRYAISGYELMFVADMQHRYDRHGEETSVSDRQRALLERIAKQ